MSAYGLKNLERVSVQYDDFFRASCVPIDGQSDSTDDLHLNIAMA